MEKPEEPLDGETKGPEKRPETDRGALLDRLAYCQNFSELFQILTALKFVEREGEKPARYSAEEVIVRIKDAAEDLEFRKSIQDADQEPDVSKITRIAGIRDRVRYFLKNGFELPKE